MPVKNIPGFYGGVSTQAPTLRLDSQVEAMENCMTSLLRGTEKRPPASIFQTLASSTAVTGTKATSFVTGMIKSGSEAYLLVITDHATAPVNIYNLDTGVKATVTYSSNGTHHTYDYLIAGAASPRNKLKATTVEDYTFVTNNSITAAMDTSLTKAKQKQRIIFHVKRGQASTTYSATIIFSDANYRNQVVSAVYTSGAAEVDTQSIASNLAQAIDTAFDGLSGAYPQYGVYVYESYVVIYPDATWTKNAAMAATDTVLAGDAEDGLGGTALAVISCENLSGTTADNFVNTVRSFDELPPKMPKGTGTLWVAGVSSSATVDETGVVVKIQEETADSVGYYVVYTVSSSTWVETAIPGIVTSINPNTLPVQIVKTSTDTFVVQYFANRTDLLTRTIGDTTSNPEPLFIGRAIEDVVFHKNRLGFLAGDALVLSKASDYFNFWTTTATDVLDDDVIELSASNTTTASIILKDAIVWNENLLINTSGKQQLTLTSEGILSPKSARLDIVTNFDLSTVCKPVGSGSNVYYSETGSSSSNLREFYIQDDGITKDAINVASHVEGYIGADVVSMISYPTKGLIGMLPTAGDALYIYQFLQGSEGKAQSAFHKWTIAGHVIHGMTQYGKYLFLFTSVAGGTGYILRIPLDQSKEYGNVMLDFAEIIKGAYEDYANDNRTTFRPTYPVTVGTTKVVVMATGKELPQLTDPHVTGEIDVLGDYSAANTVVIGIPYTSSVTLSEVIYRDQNGVAQEDIQVILDRLKVSFRNTGYFKISAIPRGGVSYRKASIKEFDWFHINMDNLTTVDLKNSSELPFPFSCLLRMAARGATVQIINDSYLPMEIMNTSIIYSGRP